MQPVSSNEPRWWTDAHHGDWALLREALRREWEEEERRAELTQDVDSASELTLGTVRFWTREPSQVPVDLAADVPDDDFEPLTFEAIEPWLRYGVGARRQYPEYSVWTDELEARLRRDWAEANDERAWETVREYVRRGWESARNAAA